jgi:hypothetical protein
MLAALDALEAELVRRPLAATTATIGQDGVTSAAAWHFIQSTSVATLVPPARFPSLHAFSAVVEALPAFRAAPHGDATYRAAPR